MQSSDLARQFIQHRDLLYGYVFALTRDHDLAEDSSRMSACRS